MSRVASESSRHAASRPSPPFPSPGSTSSSSSSPAEYPDPAMAWRASPAVPVYSAFWRNWRPSMYSADR